MINTQKKMLKMIIREQVETIILEEGFGEKIEQATKKIAAGVLKKLVGSISKISDVQNNPAVQELMSTINQSGIKLELPKEAQQLVAISKKLESETPQAKQALTENVDRLSLYRTLKKIDRSHKTVINESLGIVAIAGLTLSTITLLSWVGKSIAWIGEKMKWETAKSFGHTMEHFFHDLETSIHGLVPNKLSYFVYKTFWEKDKGASLSSILGKNAAAHKDLEEGKMLDESEWEINGTLRPAIESTLFKVALIVLLIPTIVGAIHSFGTLLGAIEAGAGVVKAREITQGLDAAATIATG